ncbi:MAG: hypothetical protein JW940_03315 [Polyangiaceae bacterium]|nr:hypothetical protein [Polyangiaceae bacterium]
MALAGVCQAPGCDDHPQVCVDWCDAYAYCKGVGKRLCGEIGGGPTDFGAYADVNQDPWYNACTSHGARSSSGFVYGDDYNPQACNGIASTVSCGGVAHETGSVEPDRHWSSPEPRRIIARQVENERKLAPATRAWTRVVRRAARPPEPRLPPTTTTLRTKTPRCTHNRDRWARHRRVPGPRPCRRQCTRSAARTAT